MDYPLDANRNDLTRRLNLFDPEGGSWRFRGGDGFTKPIHAHNRHPSMA